VVVGDQDLPRRQLATMMSLEAAQKCRDYMYVQKADHAPCAFLDSTIYPLK
jgi:hypothetical protein